MIRQNLNLAMGLILAAASVTAAGSNNAAPTTLIQAIVTSTTWTSLDMVVPHPYSSPSISLTEELGTTTAVFSIFSANPCGGQTEFASTKTVNLPVDCKGASQLSVTIQRGRCPLGGRKPPAIVDTVTATPRTSFDFTCAPTPAGTAHPVSYVLTDRTSKLPIPTLKPGQSPVETPVAMSAIYYPDGQCRVALDLVPADGSPADSRQWISSLCSASYLYPKTYPATVTSTITAGCGRCQYIRGGDMYYTCAQGSFDNLTPLSPAVQIATASTKNDVSYVAKALKELHDTNRQLGIETRQDLNFLKNRVVSMTADFESANTSKNMQDVLDAIQKSDVARKKTREPESSGLDMVYEGFLSTMDEYLETLRDAGQQVPLSNALITEILTYLDESSTSLEGFEQSLEARKLPWALLANTRQPVKSRRRGIEVAFTKTFDWIFTDKAMTTETEGARDHHHFITHAETRGNLGKWAGKKRLIIASFCFCNAGTSLQRSQEGLLRSLLFEILRLCPELIPSLVSPKVLESLGDKDGSLDVSELLNFYKAILKQPDIQMNHQDLIKILNDLEYSPGIKMCLSSRPWMALEDEYGEDPTNLLKLENPTKGDIRQVVNDKFNAHSQFVSLNESEPGYDLLIDQVVNRSQRVFLWVHLVLRDLLDGLTYSDSIKTLQVRLESFPEDLDRFFQHMLDSVPRIYLDRASRMFKLAVHAEEPLLLMFYLLLEDIEDDEGFTMDQPIYGMPPRRDGSPRTQTSSNYFNVKVDFLHRTVRDFLRESEASSIDAEPPATAVHLRILRDLIDKANKTLCWLSSSQDHIAIMISSSLLFASICKHNILFYIEQKLSETGQPGTIANNPHYHPLEFALCNHTSRLLEP
ncbi:hypothetical protein B0H63DRAFT_510281 [Podospora didyma]|uniref:DUF7791 domain-containing protein n=1 Tax=Podospora didyma TaxID=330526 RepID=A0AAE0NPU4_9PEZI|nr:hypothetical protein B0H63DRAFT_510281 [Podospora didyma]